MQTNNLSVDQLQAMLAQAKSQAEQVASTQAAQLPTVAVSPTVPATVPAAPAPAPRQASLDDFEQGMNVRNWLKVKDTGLYINKNPGLVAEVIVSIDLSEVSVTQAVNYGNPAVYHRTRDGVTCEDGLPWAEALAKARMVGGPAKARPYPSAAIPMVLLENAMNVLKPGEVVLEAGETLGYSTPATAKGSVKDLMTQAARLGLKEGGPMRVKITSKASSNAAGNTYGVIQFEVLGPAVVN